MFRKILIANRGEIAVRVIQACRELGIPTVAVHSEADRTALHVELADEAVCIGPARSIDSYLSISAVISAAEVTDAEAVHPGYGFLAENDHFVDVLGECNVAFIGPSADAIRTMGNKAQARQAAEAAGVPVVPGSGGPVSSPEEALEVAEQIGYPVILKASAGGGGRGMRIVESPDQLPDLLDLCRSEAKVAFGSEETYLEKYLTTPRHIEIQILSDAHGNHVHLGERECSIQRRHQKLIEESPSPAVDEALRAKMGASAVKLAAAVDYLGAGTVEFLLDEDGSFYFMEMNTRIQVEHPVTEEVTGLDLLKEQIRVAAGEPISEVILRDPFRLRGHAIEFRVNAEDPDNFRPSPGRLETFHLPGGPGVRVDTHAYPGYTIPPHYDSLVAKLIVRGRDRAEAIERGRRALESFVIKGIKTTIPLHLRILEDERFLKGQLSTRFMESFLS